MRQRGLSAGLQTQIYGESQEAMSGGTVYQGTPLSAEELEANKTALAEKAAAALFESAVKKAGLEYVTLRELFAATGTEVLAGPAAGQPTGDYKLAVRVRGRILAFTGDEIMKILNKKLIALLPPGGSADAYAFNDVTYRVVSVQPSENAASLVASADASKQK